MLRAEAMLDRWAVPNLRDRPTELVHQVEAQRDLVAGVFGALRAAHIDFRPLDDPALARPEDGDYDVTRLEASLGYRLALNAGIILSTWDQTQRGAADAEGRLVGVRLWWAF